MSLEFIQNVSEMQKFVQSFSGSRGFVPTMGALHEGHLSLIERSIKENEQSIVSIFVNPTQFNNPADLKNYPMHIEKDLEMLKGLKIDAVFYPSYEEIYADQFRYQISENQDSKTLCGSDRAGHFEGVLTVVMKLLNIVSPTKAYFGEKDFQQLKLIEGMTKAFFLKTQIIACPTVRSSTGLAFSSRNQKLSEENLNKAHFSSR
jgi:pantoate--beta-alanine ligase